MIRVEKLSKVFGNVTVLKEINVEIHKGEIISIIGPSGTGKSTFLRCLNLLEQPTSGKIFIDEIDILDKNTNVPKLRQKMGMVFQSFNLFNHLTVLENLTIGQTKLLKRTKAEAESKSHDLLRLVGLSEKADNYADELSGGQKQRVAIARCLSMDPEIILFDEPTSALDPTMVSEVLAVIRRLAKEGMTMAIVTHEMDFARDVSNRVFYMDEGIIYEDGSPRQIFDSPQKEKTRAFINRIRSLNYSIRNTSFDFYAMNGEIEHFCEKHVLPKKVVNNIKLIFEELIIIYNAVYTEVSIDVTVSYSEKNEAVELLFTYEGKNLNLIEHKMDDDIGQNIIKNLCQSITYSSDAELNKLFITLK